MLIKSYNLSQLNAKILEGTFDGAEKLVVELGCIQQSNWTRNQENINWISTSGIINVSVYLLESLAGYSTRCSGKLSAGGS